MDQNIELTIKGPVTRRRSGLVSTPERVLRARGETSEVGISPPSRRDVTPKKDIPSKRDVTSKIEDTPKRSLRKSSDSSSVKKTPVLRNARASSVQPVDSPVTKRVLSRRRSSSLQPETPTKEVKPAVLNKRKSNTLSPSLSNNSSRSTSTLTSTSPSSDTCKITSPVLVNEGVKRITRRSTTLLAKEPSVNKGCTTARRRSSVAKSVDSSPESENISNKTPNNSHRRTKNHGLSPVEEKIDETSCSSSPHVGKILKPSIVGQSVSSIQVDPISPTDKTGLQLKILTSEDSIHEKVESCGESEDSGIKEMEEMPSVDSNTDKVLNISSDQRPLCSDVFEDQNDDPNSKLMSTKVRSPKMSKMISYFESNNSDTSYSTRSKSIIDINLKPTVVLNRCDVLAETSNTNIANQGISKCFDGTVKTNDIKNQVELFITSPDGETKPAPSDLNASTPSSLCSTHNKIINDSITDQLLSEIIEEDLSGSTSISVSKVKDNAINSIGNITDACMLSDTSLGDCKLSSNTNVSKIESADEIEFKLIIENDCEKVIKGIDANGEKTEIDMSNEVNLSPNESFPAESTDNRHTGKTSEFFTKNKEEIKALNKAEQSELKENQHLSKTDESLAKNKEEAKTLILPVKSSYLNKNEHSPLTIDFMKDVLEPDSNKAVDQPEIKENQFFSKTDEFLSKENQPPCNTIDSHLEDLEEVDLNKSMVSKENQQLYRSDNSLAKDDEEVDLNKPAEQSVLKENEHLSKTDESLATDKEQAEVLNIPVKSSYLKEKLVEQSELKEKQHSFSSEDSSAAEDVEEADLTKPMELSELKEIQHSFSSYSSAENVEVNLNKSVDQSELEEIKHSYKSDDSSIENVEDVESNKPLEQSELKIQHTFRSNDSSEDVEEADLNKPVEHSSLKEIQHSFSSNDSAENVEEDNLNKSIEQPELEEIKHSYKPNDNSIENVEDADSNKPLEQSQLKIQHAFRFNNSSEDVEVADLNKPVEHSSLKEIQHSFSSNDSAEDVEEANLNKSVEQPELEEIKHSYKSNDSSIENVEDADANKPLEQSELKIQHAFKSKDSSALDFEEANLNKPVEQPLLEENQNFSKTDTFATDNDLIQFIVESNLQESNCSSITHGSSAKNKEKVKVLSEPMMQSELKETQDSSRTGESATGKDLNVLLEQSELHGCISSSNTDGSFAKESQEVEAFIEPIVLQEIKETQFSSEVDVCLFKGKENEINTVFKKSNAKVVDLPDKLKPSELLMDASVDGKINNTILSEESEFSIVCDGNSSLHSRNSSHMSAEYSLFSSCDKSSIEKEVKTVADNKLGSENIQHSVNSGNNITETNEVSCVKSISEIPDSCSKETKLGSEEKFVAVTLEGKCEDSQDVDIHSGKASMNEFPLGNKNEDTKLLPSTKMLSLSGEHLDVVKEVKGTDTDLCSDNDSCKSVCGSSVNSTETEKAPSENSVESNQMIDISDDSIDAYSFDEPLDPAESGMHKDSSSASLSTSSEDEDTINFQALKSNNKTFYSESGSEEEEKYDAISDYKDIFCSGKDFIDYEAEEGDETSESSETSHDSDIVHIKVTDQKVANEMLNLRKRKSNEVKSSYELNQKKIKIEPVKDSPETECKVKEKRLLEKKPKMKAKSERVKVGYGVLFDVNVVNNKCFETLKLKQDSNANSCHFRVQKCSQNYLDKLVNSTSKFCLGSKFMVTKFNGKKTFSYSNFSESSLRPEPSQSTVVDISSKKQRLNAKDNIKHHPTIDGIGKNSSVKCNQPIASVELLNKQLNVRSDALENPKRQPKRPLPSTSGSKQLKCFGSTDQSDNYEPKSKLLNTGKNEEMSKHKNTSNFVELKKINEGLIDSQVIDVNQVLRNTSEGCQYKYSASIQNLGTDVNAKDLINIFYQYGITDIDSIDLGFCAPRLFCHGLGFGRIVFSNEKSMQNCINLSHDLRVKGKKIWMKAEDHYSPQTVSSANWLKDSNKLFLKRQMQHTKKLNKASNLN